jgi:hypothetical protein
MQTDKVNLITSYKGEGEAGNRWGPDLLCHAQPGPGSSSPALYAGETDQITVAQWWRRGVCVCVCPICRIMQPNKMLLYRWPDCSWQS